MAGKIKPEDIARTNHLSARDAAAELGVHHSNVYRARARFKSDPEVSTKGKSDGTYDCVIPSDTPWGYDDFCEFIAARGQDPNEVTFTWGVTSNPNGGYWNKLNNVKQKPVTQRDLTEKDLPALYAAVNSRTPDKGFDPNEGFEARVTVVVWADPQIGKVGSRGGTAELLERSASKRDKLKRLLSDRRPAMTVLLDAGDGIEGFESGGNPMFTNDLSLAGQLDLYGTELMEWIKAVYEFSNLTKVACVSSNHAAWRNGKQNLGNPQDDLGLFMHRQVEKLVSTAGMSVSWTYPNDYDESVALDVYGTVVGMVHGNQFSPGGAINWWEKQTFGSQAVTKADVLVTGHYHSFGAGVAGRNPHSGRQRWWLGAPTLDNGSDWFRQTAGRDSDPGVLVFDITEDGFDLGSLTIL